MKASRAPWEEPGTERGAQEAQAEGRCALCLTQTVFILTRTQERGPLSSHFTDGETEAQSGSVPPTPKGPRLDRVESGSDRRSSAAPSPRPGPDAHAPW